MRYRNGRCLKLQSGWWNHAGVFFACEVLDAEVPLLARYDKSDAIVCVGLKESQEI